MKGFQIKDTLELLYKLLQSKFLIKNEPAEIQSEISLDVIEHKINKYLPAVEKTVVSIENSIKFYKKCINANREISILLSEQDFDYPEMRKNAIDHYSQQAVLTNVCDRLIIIGFLDNGYKIT